ncbi:MAG: stress response translation initiation inhibitor YciH [Nanohaloarchaea archaeon]|nr:stress response translation initiation inhibitor YciH [Candidatus Nanohaloarchaea archaeon]
MQDICNKCGLPKDLCVCDTISKEAQQIEISYIRKRFRKYSTMVKGLDPKSTNIKEITTTLKGKLACGGTSKNGLIELQGKHAEEVKKLLIDMGFGEESIIIS